MPNSTNYWLDNTYYRDIILRYIPVLWMLPNIYSLSPLFSSIAMFKRVKEVNGYRYLQLCESYRENGEVKQRVVHSFGNLDKLKQEDRVDEIMECLEEVSNLSMLLKEDVDNNEDIEEISSEKIGPPLLFGRIWKQLGIDDILSSLLEERNFEIDLPLITFISTINRLISPGSDRDCFHWQKNYDFSLPEDLLLKHFYRTMAWLGEEVEGPDEFDPVLGPLCTKDLIEERLFSANRDLFTDLSLVFFDTTSLYFEGEGGKMARRGKSKDKRPDAKQVVFGILIDETGRPICSQTLAGNTSDVTTLIPVIDRLRERFPINRVCVVADRGMISEKNRKKIEERDLEYILGAKMRNLSEVRDEVLSHPGRYREVHPPGTKSDDPEPLEVKDVTIQDRRYIVCKNQEQARRDRKVREQIIKRLQEELPGSGKKFVGNKGYKKYIREEGDEGEEVFKLNREKIKEEERFDGKWVLATTTELPSEEVALTYKNLLRVEESFRTMKQALSTRPIYHQTDQNTRGHIFISFLSLLLRHQLEKALEEEEVSIEWKRFIRDLDQLERIHIKKGGTEALLREETKGQVGKAFQTAGVRLPKKFKLLTERDV